ncbi:TPA: hypothetical protein ACGBET_003568 [Bacillus cereus]
MIMYIKLKNINKTCFACPTTFDGETADGKKFYCRYRGGEMSFEIDGITILRLDYGGPYSGCCNWDEFKEQARCNGLLINDSELEIVAE